MIKRTLPLTMVIATALATPTTAAQKIDTQLNTSTRDGDSFSDVGFEDESCGGECYIATLSCSASGSISVELADVDAKHAALAITKETKQILLTAGGTSIDYFIQEMKYQEMTGSWWVTAHTQDVKAREFAPAIAGAKTIVALVGKQKVVLPVDANVKTWAAKCK